MYTGNISSDVQCAWPYLIAFAPYTLNIRTNMTPHSVDKSILLNRTETNIVFIRSGEVMLCEMNPILNIISHDQINILVR